MRGRTSPTLSPFSGAFELMNFALKMRNFVFTMMNFVFKMMKFVLKMMNFDSSSSASYITGSTLTVDGDSGVLLRISIEMAAF